LKLKLEIEPWKWILKLKLETESCNWNSKLKLEIKTQNWNLKLNLEIESRNWNLKLKLRAFLTPGRWFLGLGLFQNMFHNLLIYTNNFCFGYITVPCFFETFLGGWVAGCLCLGVVGKSNCNENLVVSLDLDLDFGLRLRVSLTSGCKIIKRTWHRLTSEWLNLS